MRGHGGLISRRRFLTIASMAGTAALLPLPGAVRRARGDEPALLDPLAVPKFVSPLPNPLDPRFVFAPVAGTHYEITVRPCLQDLGLGVGATRVWGYAGLAQQAGLPETTYPGRTIVAQRDVPITVRWANGLVDGLGLPIAHLLPVDPTLHWADPLEAGHVVGPYTGPVPIVTHLHGGHTRSDSDGLPDAWFTPGDIYTGRLFNPVFTYDNDQQAATLWYHDHALGITRLNVYAGLAGFYIVRDAWEASLGLPEFPYEVPIVIQDRSFTADGQLHYPSLPEESEAEAPSAVPEFFGNVILVNGRAWPVLDVEPRLYRFRILNGSDSRFYTLGITPGASAQAGLPFMQIGTDLGLLPAPVVLPKLTLGPGERADVLVDFAGFDGHTLVVRNTARAPFPKGATPDPRAEGHVMAFRVGTAVTQPANPVPPQLVDTLPGMPDAVRTRRLLLFEGEDSYGRLQPMLGIVDPSSPLDGALLWSDEVTETPHLNDVELWEVFNATEDAHPIHLHLVAFRILDRQKFTATVSAKPLAGGSLGGALSNVALKGQPRPPAANEAGWKDTAQMFPGEVTRLVARFDRPGEYVWHCHILSHEDHEMMRPYRVV